MLSNYCEISDLLVDLEKFQFAHVYIHCVHAKIPKNKYYLVNIYSKIYKYFMLTSFSFLTYTSVSVCMYCQYEGH